MADEGVFDVDSLVVQFQQMNTNEEGEDLLQGSEYYLDMRNKLKQYKDVMV
jgi:hypothetical protein